MNIYITAPAHASSGGPEDLHLLCYHMRKDFGLNSYMYYYGYKDDNPVSEPYRVYQNPYVFEVEDNPEDILVVPEVSSGISEIVRYKKIKKFVWWLSVDNFYKTTFYNNSDLIDIFYNRFPLKDYEPFKSVKLHLAQSYYAFDHLKRKGIFNIAYLSDYIVYQKKDFNEIISRKKNKVCYNPAKGYVFSSKIIEKAKDIEFIPLQNMTRREVFRTLEDSKVYIDFGEFPGKDKIPREAALCGCCVIIGKRGSANFKEDFPIDDEFRFEYSYDNIEKIIDKIKYIFKNYEQEFKKFKNYVKVIESEKNCFISDIKKIFVDSEILEEEYDKSFGCY